MSVSPEQPISYQKEARAIRRSILINAPISRVWRALATSAGLASWLMSNNFQPIVGASFTFKAKSRGDWNGVVECVVTEVDEPRRLAFSWSESPELAPTLVTFELSDLGDKTEVCLVHSGREQLPPEQESLLDQGWGCGMLRRLAALAEYE